VVVLSLSAVGYSSKIRGWPPMVRVDDSAGCSGGGG
jgi:hypothetical protein